MGVRNKLYLLKRRLFRERDGEAVLRERYRALYGEEVDVESPVCFSEKLFARMIRINRGEYSFYTRLADKYLVRDYVRLKIGAGHLPELLWHGTDPGQIPFDALPPRCVLKTNHASGMSMVWRDSLNRDEVVAQLQRWLRTNHYWVAREYQYYRIPRRILIESLLDDGRQDGPLDYRVWCFHGRPELIQVDNHRHDINPFYDTSWNKVSLCYRDGFRDCEIEKPANLFGMLEIAARLSSDFDFVRVDLYNLGGRIYFGELTFTPFAGGAKLKPGSWDRILGTKWRWAA